MNKKLEGHVSLPALDQRVTTLCMPSVWRFDVLLWFVWCVWVGVGRIGRASLARENEAGRSWGQEIHILHVNI